MGTADDVQDANNTDSPWVDQSQTYTSHASHQVFLREYAMNPAGNPVSTGSLLGGGPGNGATGMATWASVKKQAADKLGLALTDVDVLNVPMLATDPYGNFIPGAHGLPQYVTKGHGLVEGDLAHPVAVPSDVRTFDTPFLTDIAHNADPSPQDTDHNPGTPPVAPTPDANTTASADFAHQDPGTYDDEMLNAHFCAGDGRVNENIALTTIHQIFHSEHDRLVNDIKQTLTDDTSDAGVAALAEWKLASGAGGWNGERLFQAARYVNEMEYQHIVFEDFGRKVQPAIRPFHIYHSDVNAAIPAEFAHAVYRFGHSMLDDDVARRNEDGSDNSTPLLNAFLNPPEYFNGGSAGRLTPEQAAGSIIMGSSDQVGNELDEFVTETLRNNLLGLPLDLPTLNMARAREAGVPPLNGLRRQIFGDTNDGQMAPYTSWSDFGQHLKHPESLINFVAAYGKHPTITSASTLAGKRAAAKALVDPASPADAPADAADFMFGHGDWANNADGVTKTGMDDVDLWVGGLAEVTNINGGLLGTTFNYVFQTTMENLQEGDRLYYLNRTPGMNLRTQLEGNSFAELVQRNTDGTHALKSDAFATADCRFEMSKLDGTAAAYDLQGATVADDPASDCDESKLLLRKPDGTIQYRQINSVDPSGINGQSVYNGTSGVDRMYGGNDNDTFWGGLGDDIIEGNAGDDVALGGPGKDTITDLGGADVLKGGADGDAIDGGTGDDIVISGDGPDFTNGGANDNETFGGPGGDYIIAGQGADAVFGDGGDDWIQGGSGQDLLQGDHAAPFFDDPAEVKPGDDVLVGQVGENDYDAEGGDDVMAQNAAVDRNAGSGGFDWAMHQYDTAPADDDMAINNNLLGKPLPVIVNRDRWQETEADSGSAFNDTIRGDDLVPSAAGGGGFTGCDVLDQDGVNRIGGLAALLPQPLTGDLAPVVANSAAGGCPLKGPIWGEGNILLGGAGSDTVEGRGANDIIDGDRALNIKISVRNHAKSAQEIGSTDLMEHRYLRDGTGALTGSTLQAAVFNGTVDPADLRIVRSIENAPTAGDIDTAQFSGPRADYDITPNLNRTKMTITHARGTQADGVDTVTNVEKLKFSDQTLSVLPLAKLAPATLTFAEQVPNVTTGPTQTVTLSNSGAEPLAVTNIGFTGTNGAEFRRQGGTCPTTATFNVVSNGSCTILVQFVPTTAGAKTGALEVTDNSDGAPGAKQTVDLSGTARNPAPVAALGPAAGLDFGSRTTGTTSPAQTATLTNSGNAPLHVTSVAFGGTDPTQFNRAPGACLTNPTPASPGTLAAGASCQIPVRFAPTTAGPKSATLRVTDDHNGTAGSVQSITLGGTGVTPAAGIALSATSLNFGANLVSFLGGLAPPTRNVDVTNTGTAPLTISAVTIGAAPTASAPGDYRVTANACTGPRAPGTTCRITIRFRATVRATRNAILTIASNAPATPTATVNMTGTGI
jgi:Ca2+-binding RTX toxin-like protein